MLSHQTPLSGGRCNPRHPGLVNRGDLVKAEAHIISTEVIPYDTPQEPTLVTRCSPLGLRRRVEKFARYFRSEFDYDFVPFNAMETEEDENDDYQAYLFPNESNHDPRVWAGAVCFRWRDFGDLGSRWSLQWVWFHPFMRNRGILTAAWDRLHNDLGDFFVEPPFSPAMLGFLRRRGVCIWCWKGQRWTNEDVPMCRRCADRFDGDNDSKPHTVEIVELTK